MDESTWSEVGHLQTQPLSPVPFAPAPLGAIPSQRGPDAPAGSSPGPVRSEPVEPVPAEPVPAKPVPAEPALAEPSLSKSEPARLGPSKANGRMFVGAAVLTGCALLSGIWGTVVTSGTGNKPGPTVSSIGSGAGAAAATPAQRGVVESAASVLAPGQINGEGVFGVGADLPPGTYRTAGPSPAAFDNCYWERSKDSSGQQKSVIASGLVSGPATVTIKATDRAFKSSGCETWTKVD